LNWALRWLGLLVSLWLGYELILAAFAAIATLHGALTLLIRPNEI
jgi:hypothetical protein